jgi:flagellar hook-associated protein 3 FlgL
MRVDPYYVSNLVSSLDQTQLTEQNLTNELSSGVRVNSLSDDPVAAGQDVLLLDQIQQDDTFTQTANTVTSQLQVTDSTLGSVVTELTSAISKATSANNGTLNSSDIKSISNELTGIRNEVLSLANTSYEGQYLFSGSSTGSTPFTLSTTTSPATVTYNGDDGINYIETPNGQKIQLNVPGDTIFTANGTSSVLNVLNDLVSDYSSGTVDINQAVTDTEALNTALNYVSQQRVTIDNSITQLSSASTAATNEKTQLTVTQTDLMQASTATVATQLSLAETKQTSLEDMISSLSSNSLFDKL